MRMFFLCLLNTLLMATGQMMFKTGSAGKTIGNIGDILHLFFTPIIFGALCLYAGTTGLWIYILSKMPISVAYPIQALAFPIVLICSVFFFKEHIAPIQWVGVAVICVGVFLTTRR